MQQYVHSSKPQRADVLQTFLLEHNFTKNSVGSLVRPPAIGEETDLQSVGGRSSHSSVSEVSTATPRRADIDLGFEPEGSASPLPPYERWKQSLDSMLQDSEGFSAFKSFLSGTGEESILECWLAMKGFRDFDRPRSSGNSSSASSTTGPLPSRPNQGSERLGQKMKLAKLIYKTYIAKTSDKCVSNIKSGTKQYILNQIKAAFSNKNTVDLDSNLFVEAQSEIELSVEATTYKNFLSSDEFSRLSAQHDSNTPKLSAIAASHPALSQSPKTSETCTDPEQPITGSSIPYMPRLDEDQVWHPTDKRHAGTIPTQPLKDTTSDPKSKSTMPLAAGVKSSFAEASDAYPYFTAGSSYAVPPASAIGSDQASKSSDATSDTLSFTDNSSVDGVTYASTRQGQKRLMRSHIKKNPTNALPECKDHVQRTSLMKDIPNLATKDPAAFFSKLEVKLLQLQEEQEMKCVGGSFRSRPPPPPIANPMASIKNVEEDMDEVLESHLKRSIQSPGGRFSPETLLKRKVTGQPPTDSNPPRSDAFGIGIVPGITQNEVPDVDTPIIPVDKTTMISAWIQTMKKKSKSMLPSAVAPSSGHYLHSAESTGLKSGASNRKMHPLAQYPNMPLLDKPDAGTTIEEVKRRLMEETDRSCGFSDMTSLDFALPPATTRPGGASHPIDTPSVKTQSALEAAHQEEDTDSSSSETATLTNMNNDHSQMRESRDSTSVVYYMLHEDVPYRIKVPHNPITLGQFKNALPRKGDFRYYFRQYSVELQRTAFFRISDDGEILPKHDGIVLAKVDTSPV